MNKAYVFSENGFSMTDDKVAVPACRIKAESFVEASNKLTAFLTTQQLTDDIELITPLERISFDN